MAGAQDLDPELLRLPKPRVRIGWLLALCVAILSASLVFKLWPDLTFWRQPATALDVPPVTASIYPVDQYIRVKAAPERAYMGRVFRGSGGSGVRLAPLQGTDARLWVLIAGSAWDSAVAYDEQWQGRLKSLDSLPFAGVLRNWFDELPPMPRPVHVKSVEQALAAHKTTVTTTTGNALEMRADTPIRIAENLPGFALLTAFATPDHPDEAHWNATLVNRKILDRGQLPERETLSSWTYRVSAPDGVRPIVTALAQAGLLATEVKPFEREHTASWRDLSSTGKALLIGNQEIPWSDIIAISAATTRKLPKDARVLLVGQTPDRYWYAPVLVALFTLLALLFVWAFVLAMRPIPPVNQA